MSLHSALVLAFAPLLLAAAQDTAPAPFATQDGPAWENDKAAYILSPDTIVPVALDKRSPAPVLTTGGRPITAAEGLGTGGIGVVRDNGVAPISGGTTSTRVWTTPRAATTLVERRDFAGDGGSATLSTTYRIFAGTRVTQVESRATGRVPALAAGLTLPAGATRIVSPKRGLWRYVAGWSNGVGAAIFYPFTEALMPESDGTTRFVRFCDPRAFRYAFAATSSDDESAPQTPRAFRRWLDETAAELAAQPFVVPTTQRACSAG